MSSLVAFQDLSVSSLDISELVGSRHDDVKRSITRLVERGVIHQPPMADGPKSANKLTPKVYIFAGEQGRRDSYVVVARLSPEFTAKLVDRWQELENQHQPTTPKSFPETSSFYLYLIASRKIKIKLDLKILIKILSVHLQNQMSELNLRNTTGAHTTLHLQYAWFFVFSARTPPVYGGASGAAFGLAGSCWSVGSTPLVSPPIRLNPLCGEFYHQQEATMPILFLNIVFTPMGVIS
ncbi:hypothetical protein F9L16_23545 [Agarivorans sp. B2Z047]|uniref:Rha family transcriptional regulator n=1 Tax=Agarivorans sp. B2Z047 TaxID=2652721 RepID=UPI00128D96D6|nr:Rha family transcriptional regulator [Agarivorans sp. B2Z047]MPW31932.1 hypothetical protein [Agarivorans sp. B2Z047]UQN41902.1 Rha family transcriptional regulator [Agarivorans sp. B2Z047]